MSVSSNDSGDTSWDSSTMLQLDSSAVQFDADSAGIDELAIVPTRGIPSALSPVTVRSVVAVAMELAQADDTTNVLILVSSPTCASRVKDSLKLRSLAARWLPLPGEENESVANEAALTDSIVVLTPTSFNAFVREHRPDPAGIYLVLAEPSDGILDALRQCSVLYGTDISSFIDWQQSHVFCCFPGLYGRQGSSSMLSVPAPKSLPFAGFGSSSEMESATSSSMTLSSGTVLHIAPRSMREFKSLRLLGKGGFGVVEQVQSLLDLGMYALKKVVLPAYTTTEESLQLALYEARVLASLDHPHVCRYHHCWIEETGDFDPTLDEEDEGSSFEDGSDQSCSEIESGNDSGSGDDIPDTETDTSEADSIESRPVLERSLTLCIQMSLYPLSLQSVLTSYQQYQHQISFWPFAMGLFSGLSYLHQVGIVHNDLKPANILLSPTPEGHFLPVIADFGLAVHSQLPKTSRSSGAGTFVYAAPEVIAAGKQPSNKKGKGKEKEKGGKKEEKTATISKKLTLQRSSSFVSFDNPTAPPSNSASGASAAVDIYSSALICCEICLQPMTTSMERMASLQDVRKHQWQTLRAKQSWAHAAFCRSLEQLLAPLPEDRPSSQEVLSLWRQFAEKDGSAGEPVLGTTPPLSLASSHSRSRSTPTSKRYLMVERGKEVEEGKDEKSEILGEIAHDAAWTIAQLRQAMQAELGVPPNFKLYRGNVPIPDTQNYRLVEDVFREGQTIARLLW
jgi:serine/threonine protein kinase